MLLDDMFPKLCMKIEDGMKLIILSMAFTSLGSTHARGEQTNPENEPIIPYKSGLASI